MTKRLMSLVAILLLAAALSLSAQSPSVRLESARYQEEAQGDLEGAIALYMQVASDPASSREIAGKALLSAARCYGKLGRADAQREVYARITREFADQPALVAQARAGLVKLGPVATTPAPTDLGTRRLTRFPGVGRVGDPNFKFIAGVASDGRFAYMAQFGPSATPTRKLVRRNLATGEERTLHAASPGGSGIALSSDGLLLAIPQPLPDGRWSIAVINTQGAPVRTVGASADSLRPIAWSLDKKQLIVDTSRSRPSLRFSSRRVLMVMDVQSGSLRTIREFDYRDGTSGTILGASYSADGAWIAYDWINEDRERRAIHLVASSGGVPRAIVDGPGNSAVLGFVPGTRDLLFISDRSGSIDAYTMEVDAGGVTGGARVIKENIGLIQFVGWSESGFLYTPRPRSTVVLATADTQTGEFLNSQVVSSRHVLSGLFPAMLSPDKQRIAYAASPQPLTDGRPVLIVRDIKSGREKEIELYPAVSTPVIGNWSPKGDAVWLAGWAPSGDRASVRIDVTSGEVLTIHSTKQCFEAFADGEHVLCLDRATPPRLPLSKLHWRSGTETPLVNASGMIFQGISPDGRRLAYFEDPEQLAIYDLTSGTTRTIRKFDPNQRVAPIIIGWPTNDDIIVRTGALPVNYAVVSADGQSVRTLPGNWNDSYRPASWPQVLGRQDSGPLELWALEHLPARPPAARDRRRH